MRPKGSERAACSRPDMPLSAHGNSEMGSEMSGHPSVPETRHWCAAVAIALPEVAAELAAHTIRLRNQSDWQKKMLNQVCAAGKGTVRAWGAGPRAARRNEALGCTKRSRLTERAVFERAGTFTGTKAAPRTVEALAWRVDAR